jgi:hypothetical protein
MCALYHRGKLGSVADPTADGSASFYLDEEQEPTLVFEGHVGEVLDAQGAWQEINRRIECDPGDFFDRYEEYRVPVDKLLALASACRTIAREIDESGVYESRAERVRSSPSCATEQFQIVTTATGSELRRALFDLADLADQAQKDNKTIWAALL